jgi:hypothetical protein
MSEICDFGFPQTTDADTLKLYVTSESIVKSSKKNSVSLIIENSNHQLTHPKLPFKQQDQFLGVDLILNIARMKCLLM